MTRGRSPHDSTAGAEALRRGEGRYRALAAATAGNGVGHECAGVRRRRSSGVAGVHRAEPRPNQRRRLDRRAPSGRSRPHRRLLVGRPGSGRAVRDGIPPAPARRRVPASRAPRGAGLGSRTVPIREWIGVGVDVTERKLCRAGADRASRAIGGGDGCDRAARAADGSDRRAQCDSARMQLAGGGLSSAPHDRDTAVPADERRAGAVPIAPYSSRPLRNGAARD